MEQQILERDTFGNAIFSQNGNGFLQTGTIDMSVCKRVNFVINCGTFGSGGNAGAGLQYGNNASGNDATNMGAAFIITNISTNNQQATIELAYGASEMQGRRYVRGYINVSTIASQICGIIYGTDLRYVPQKNATSAGSGAAPPDNISVAQRVAG